MRNNCFMKERRYESNRKKSEIYRKKSSLFFWVMIKKKYDPFSSYEVSL